MDEKTRVLIVDDDENIRTVLSRQLEEAGFACEQAEDGQAGQDLLLGDDFDVALVDLRMPKMGGLPLIRAIQESKCMTVMVILSGHGEVKNVVEVMKYGAFDFIEKPAPPEVIQAAVERAATHAYIVRHAEDMARLAEEWETVFDASPDMILVLDNDMRILRCNRATAVRLQKEKETLLGHSCHEIFDGLGYFLELCPFSEVPNGQVTDSAEFHHPGWNTDFSVILMPLTNGSGEIWGSVCTLHDVTEQKALVAQLSQAQKLEAIGQLAAGIAHEINTPTQYVGDNTRFLKDSFGDLMGLFDKYDAMLVAAKEERITPDLIAEIESAMEEADVEYLVEEIPKAIQQSLDGLGQVAKIVLAMKEFSHPGTAEKTAVDVNQLLESTITISRNEWKYVAEMVTDFDQNLGLVPCLPGEFNQVVLNLIVNAAHAIAKVVGEHSERKGTITVCTRGEGPWAEIRISDTGSGIPEAIRDRVFDPFYTTKEVGKGTGQGLAIARSVVVDKHKGTITFDSEEGKGTIFIVRLPIGNGAV